MTKPAMPRKEPVNGCVEQCEGYNIGVVIGKNIVIDKCTAYFISRLEEMLSARTWDNCYSQIRKLITELKSEGK